MSKTVSESNILNSPSLVIEKYFDMVYRFARKTAGADKADDAVQNVFMRYLKHYTDFSEEEHLKAWLLRVTYNCSVSELKNTWTERTTSLPEDIKCVEERIDSETDDTITDLVNTLPSKYKSVIHLYYYEEYTTREIAQAMDIKETTVRTLLARGRKKLKKLLKEE